MKYDGAFFSQFCLPAGKADDTPSAFGMTPTVSVLERVHSSELQLHPFRLASGASSTFAQLGFLSNFPCILSYDNVYPQRIFLEFTKEGLMLLDWRHHAG
jgi:hypothetical protein